MARRIDRPWQALLIAATFAGGWWGMQIVHESGHVLHAWVSGGRVTAVVLRPLEISRTDVAPNPHPQFVAWGGPLWGALLPAGLWWIARRLNWTRAWLWRFFAGFCLIANGAYLLGGSAYPVGDADVLLREGAPRAALLSYGASAVAAGLWLWNRLGPNFGIGTDAPPVDRTAAVNVALGAIGIIALEMLWMTVRS
ncbi:MAG: M50 family metallopeptidase [Planctomycetaceae bacterium]